MTAMCQVPGIQRSHPFLSLSNKMSGRLGQWISNSSALCFSPPHSKGSGLVSLPLYLLSSSPSLSSIPTTSYKPYLFLQLSEGEEAFRNIFLARASVPDTRCLVNHGPVGSPSKKGLTHCLVNQLLASLESKSSLVCLFIHSTSTLVGAW
jgi:hypothetical protein